MGAERPLSSVGARCAALGFGMMLVTVPVYLWVEPSWRALVARVAAAFVVGVALVELRRALADRLAAGRASALDWARRPRGPEAGAPEQFVHVTKAVRAALRSRHYFEHALWPRLVSLASFPLIRPRGRRGRGPSLADLRSVIAAIERQS